MIITKFWALITIQQRTVGQDELGQPLTGWETFATVYSDPRFLRGLESLRASALTAMVRGSFRIRHLPGVQASMRIVWDDVVYNITAVLPQGRRDVVDLTAESIGPVSQVYPGD